MGKIIRISKAIKNQALTPLMLKTLRVAFQKQERNEHLGQIDLDGSFTSLLKRGLIDLKTVNYNGKSEAEWYITKQGIRTLSKLGFSDKV